MRRHHHRRGSGGGPPSRSRYTPCRRSLLHRPIPAVGTTRTTTARTGAPHCLSLSLLRWVPVAAPSAGAGPCHAGGTGRPTGCAATASRRRRRMQWQESPDGSVTLCNACGLRYKNRGLLPEYRPTTASSFQAGQHSNRHQRIMKMREQKNGSSSSSRS
jgi:hypothetical protein